QRALVGQRDAQVGVHPPVPVHERAAQLRGDRDAHAEFTHVWLPSASTCFFHTGSRALTCSTSSRHTVNARSRCALAAHATIAASPTSSTPTRWLTAIRAPGCAAATSAAISASTRAASGWALYSSRTTSPSASGLWSRTSPVNVATAPVPLVATAARCAAMSSGSALSPVSTTSPMVPSRQLVEQVRQERADDGHRSRDAGGAPRGVDDDGVAHRAGTGAAEHRRGQLAAPPHRLGHAGQLPLEHLGGGLRCLVGRAHAR